MHIHIHNLKIEKPKNFQVPNNKNDNVDSLFHYQILHYQQTFVLIAPN